MIESLKIDGYRLLDHFCADLGQLTVVIGANATGKSTLLDCLEFIAHSVEYPIREVVAWAGGLTSILSAVQDTDRLKWELTFRKPMEHPYWRKLPLSDDYSYVYAVTIAKDRYDQAIPLYELLRTERPLDGHKDPLKFLEATRHKSHIFSRTEHRLVPFDQAVAKDSGGLFDVKDVAESEMDKDIELSEQVSKQERTLRLAQMRFYNEYPIPSWCRTLLSSLAFYPGFDVGRHSNLRTKAAEIRPVTTLCANGEDLGTVLHEMVTRAAYLSTKNDLLDFLRIAYPSFDDLFAETAYGAPPKVLVRVREKGIRKSMELWDLSDGMLRFLCLGAALLNPISPPLIAIDEPETGLHPKLLPIIADMIKMASERTQVLITTHSPDLLNCFGIDDIAVMAREGNKITWERPGTRKSLRKMLENVVADSLGDLHRSGELEALG